MKMRALFGVGLAAAIGFGVTADVNASPRYGMAGCGLGSMIVTSNGFSQTFAATTNGTSGSQTFGITTGTSNCTADGVVLADREQEAFFEANYAQIQRDVAGAGGEHLAALTELMQCEDAVLPAVFEEAQKSYGAVFPNEQTTPTQALYSLKIALSRHHEIANNCARL